MSVHAFVPTSGMAVPPMTTVVAVSYTSGSNPCSHEPTMIRYVNLSPSIVTIAIAPAMPAGSGRFVAMRVGAGAIADGATATRAIGVRRTANVKRQAGTVADPRLVRIVTEPSSTFVTTSAAQPWLAMHGCGCPARSRYASCDVSSGTVIVDRSANVILPG